MWFELSAHGNPASWTSSEHQLRIRSRMCRHGHINIFEDVARSDAENPFIGFDQVVSLASAMLATKMIGEAESGSELLGFDRKRVRYVFHSCRFHGAIDLRRLAVVGLTDCRYPLTFPGLESGVFFVKAKENVRAKCDAGQFSIFGAMRKNLRRHSDGFRRVKHFIQTHGDGAFA